VTTAIDLDAYLARVGLSAVPKADEHGLEELQRAQRLTIPFENLDVRLGGGVRVALDAVFVKLVTRRRGGYCFEQNRLFLYALHMAGFAARPLLAKVWLGATLADPPRTHTMNLVELGGRPWIADAGFGGGYVPAMPLEDGIEVTGPDLVRHRLCRDVNRGWMLRRRGLRDWEDQYSFFTEPVDDAELEAANCWTATDPSSRFVGQTIISIALPHGYASMIDRRLSIHDGPWSASGEVETAEDYRIILRDRFGISLRPLDIATLDLFPSG
jgi:N-hydroxyarylamine O-acetyltransferase